MASEDARRAQGNAETFTARENVVAPEARTHVELCINLCETTPIDITLSDLEERVGQACRNAGFPYCERIYVGSYFCENYFCWMDDAFHETIRAFCERHDVRATLVVPIAGQAFLDRVDRCVDEALANYDDLYDEVVANDVATFLQLQTRYGKRMGLGRLLSKEMRDARVNSLRHGCAQPVISAEAQECLTALQTSDWAFQAEDEAAGSVDMAGFDEYAAESPIIELDPVADVVDVSSILEVAPQALVAMHLPFCFATTGRNCTSASIEKQVDEKFRLGLGCMLQCLRLEQGYLTDGGIEYMKHGRTFFFENPACSIVGASSWRIVYQAGLGQ